jgi:serine protease AprX
MNQHPGDAVSVVVRTADGAKTSDLSNQISRLGGTVQQEFDIVPGVEATIPAGSVSMVASLPAAGHISLNAPVESAGFVDPSNLVSAYQRTVEADQAWSQGVTGQGIGVAVIDTGISAGNPDFSDGSGSSRVTAQVAVSTNTNNTNDGQGHGTHVAGIIGGNGQQMNGSYIGIAPEARLINVKAGNDSGQATISDLISALQWTFNNRQAQNIRVVNLSLHSSVAESYKTDPICAAVEALWFNGVFVVVASGNTGGIPDQCPGTDPFVMTVGATDDAGTSAISDDSVTSWTTRGVTLDGYRKPEVYAPGRGIVSVSDPNTILFRQNPQKVVGSSYLTLSGTSMASPVVAGVAALALQAHPTWTPDQLKCTIVSTARSISGGAAVVSAINVVNRTAPATGCNRNIQPNQMLASVAVVAPAAVIAQVMQSTNRSATAQALGLQPAVFAKAANTGPLGAPLPLSQLTWDSISWDSISWDSISWDAISWDSISWDSISWDSISWDSISWDSISWDSISWDSISWDSISWDSISWDSISWDSISWDSISWDSISWDSISWDSITEDPEA